MSGHLYALGSLAKSLGAREAPRDPRVREEEETKRRETKIGKWQSVLAAMAEDKLAVGSRAPIRDTPTWVTLEVASGGFATGRHMAALAEGERPNADFMTEEGMAELDRMLTTGCYVVEQPENAALLVVVYLLKNGEVDEASTIIDAIAPWFDRLRFYPKTAESPMPLGAVVSISTVGEMKQQLKNMLYNMTNLYIKRVKYIMIDSAVKSTLGPLYNRAIELFADTIPCTHRPEYARNERGEILRTGAGQTFANTDFGYEHLGRRTVRGQIPCTMGDCCGWPVGTPSADGRSYELPEGWMERARVLFAEINAAMEAAPFAANFFEKRGPGEIYNALKMCMSRRGREYRSLTGYQSLTGQTVSRLRFIIMKGARAYPVVDDGGGAVVLKALIERLDGHDQRRGLTEEELAAVCLPVEGKAVTASMVQKLTRCRLGTATELIQMGLVSSMEVAGDLINALKAANESAFIEDKSLRTLCEQLHRAFSKRRSLLLLNLEAQVGISELPWFKAIASRAKPSRNARATALQTLVEFCTIALRGFPYTQLPNTFVEPLRALRVSAGVELSLMKEIASDIFEGRFSGAFTQGARDAQALLPLYCPYRVYYGLPADLSAGDLSSMYTARGWSVAANGVVIESVQIHTTHGLAAMVLFLRSQGVELPAGRLVMRAWKWMLRALGSMGGEYQAKMQTCKNVSFAWRNLIFWFSLAHRDSRLDLLREMRELAALTGPARSAALNEILLDGLEGTLSGAKCPEPVRGWFDGPGNHCLMNLPKATKVKAEATTTAEAKKPAGGGEGGHGRGAARCAGGAPPPPAP